jgi:hypothetical protein
VGVASNPLGAYAIARLIVKASPETTSPTDDQRRLVRLDTIPSAQPTTARASPIKAIGVARIGRKKRSVLITPSTTDATPSPSGGALLSERLLIFPPCGQFGDSVAGHLGKVPTSEVVRARQREQDQEPGDRRHDHAPGDSRTMQRMHEDQDDKRGFERGNR